MTKLFNWNKTSKNILSKVYVLALLCSIFIFLSSWVLPSGRAGFFVNLLRVLVMMFNFTVAYVYIYRLKPIKLPSFINELLIGVNAGILLLQTLVIKFDEPVAYFTLFSVYFIGQFSNNKSFNEYYPVLLVGGWFLVLLASPALNYIHSYILLLVSIVASVVLYLFNTSRGTISEELQNKAKELSETDELFGNMFANSPVGTAIIDNNLKFSKFNKAFVNLVGYPPNRINMLSLMDIVDEDDARVDKEILKNLFNGRLEEFREKRQIIQKNGNIQWVNMSLQRIKDDYYDSDKQIMLIAENITNEVYKYNKLEELSVKLEKAEKQIETFHKTHNYHLINPIRDIHHYLQWVKTEYIIQTDQPLYDSVGYLIEKIEHFENMIADLGELSRIDMHDSAKFFVDLETTVEVILRKIKPLVQEKKAIIHYETLPKLYVNEHYITDIIEELLVNAIQHCDTKLPIIHIKAVEEYARWIIHVIDNGNGIEEDLKSSIFDYFVRGNEQNGGTGMGLAIVKKLVENIGGEIWVKSVPNMGSTFHFSIPKEKIAMPL